MSGTGLLWFSCTHRRVNDPSSFRARPSRKYQERKNRERNQRLVDTLQKLAAEKHASASQLAIAWVLSKGKSIVALVGARTRKQLEESLGALEVQLSAADLSRIADAIPPAAVAGTRYDEHQMKVLDSER